MTDDNELHCDICGVLMGYVHEFDLNGSDFVCIGCGPEKLELARRVRRGELSASDTDCADTQ